ncbi:MAG: hypothetical protein QOD34_3946 [Mycobacterium sp.]|jgi:hypothetical protein|nr:hypothetical protein [Mycobacterium sp.]MDT5226829.1 hypothetical protein [Mycobacterium sp.]MDT7735627.1 hypothetical protein [Mycobacterium sp.]
MSQDNVNVRNDPALAADTPPVERGAGRTPRARLWVNWGLALLTAVVAGVVMAVALGAVMSTAACSDKACPNLGGGISFDVLYYGAPVVAAVTILLSIFTARRRWGLAVPVTALALLIADVAVIVTTVAQ